MITPEEFPYIKSLYINDCYAYKDFNIELHDYKPFSHLILTGKNGSGKSTILRIINNHVSARREGSDPAQIIQQNKDLARNYIIRSGPKSIEAASRIKAAFEYEAVVPSYVNQPYDNWARNKNQLIYTYLKAKRSSQVNPVQSVTKEIDFINQLQGNFSAETFVSQFKQYLVNKKVYQAFDQMNKKRTRFNETNQFFERLTNSFRKIFEDDNLTLEFKQEDFEFFINLSDKRQLTFDILSEGFSALLSIFMDLFTRVDLIRKQVNNYSYDPCGIVLIDEPETHLHLKLQEQVLPLLTSLFPNVQFIVATHSPAVIASIKNATIFDLTTKESRGSEETVGRSYSELMRAHFGLNNEYSGIADELFGKVDQLIKDHRNQPEQLKMKLQQFFVENEAYLSPTFRVELESMILENV